MTSLRISDNDSNVSWIPINSQIHNRYVTGFAGKDNLEMAEVDMMADGIEDFLDPTFGAGFTGEKEKMVINIIVHNTA